MLNYDTIAVKKQETQEHGFRSAFFTDPDPGKNLHADPDPGRDTGGIRGVIFFYFYISDVSEQLLKNFKKNLLKNL